VSRSLEEPKEKSECKFVNPLKTGVHILHILIGYIFDQCLVCYFLYFKSLYALKHER
ncbi:hypothetical protein MKW94_005761, partial [Papaver nudicaule]|nr:hypothetical protein [Papaver nudicaule]